jgi:hypothetical protein
MIGQIGPSVRAGTRRRIIGLHLAGGLAGGGVAGVAFGAAGVVAASLLGAGGRSAEALVVGAVLVCGGLADLGVVRAPMSRHMRQTPGWWPCALGHEAAAFAWGADLGLGVTTRAAYQAALAVPAIAFLSGSLSTAVAVAASYGLGRAAAVGAVTLASDADVGETCTFVSARAPALQTIVGFVALATGVAVVALSQGGL